MKDIKKLVMTGVLMMSMTAPVFASETKVPTIGEATGETSVQVHVTKDLEFAEGLAIPDTTVSFNIQKVTPDAPEATIGAITFSAADAKGNAANNKYTVSKNAEIQFGTFTHAGEYEYDISEVKGDFAGMTYSTDHYRIRVQVANKAKGGLYIKTVTAEKNTTNGTAENKAAAIKFTNTYRKNASLEVEKKTEGDLADKTKKFGFTITLEKSSTETTDAPVYTGKIGDQTVSVTAGTPTSFQLADGEKLVFESLPAGTKYTVTETGVKDGYTPSVTVVANGTQRPSVSAKDEQSLASSEHGDFVGENANKVTYVNTYNEVPVTGIIMNNLPFIMMAGIAVVAFGALLIVKKHAHNQ